MTEYAPGMRVLIRDEEWMIKKVEINSLEQKTLHCIGISSLVKDHQAFFLTDLEEIETVDPANIHLIEDESPNFKRTKLFIESQWRKKTPTDTALHVGHKAAMDVMEFQLEPAQIALEKTRQRILIADTVGLGKTLEAGILMSELIARGKGKRILVVTVKSMMKQFQKEMWNRFTIPLIRLDSDKIQKVRAELPSNYNPFFYYDKTIVSIDTIKRDVEYRTHLENAWWDIIVIDEAHNVAQRGKKQAQRSKLAQLLSKRSDTLIMLSATPHDGKSESFASLMNMLDPTAIANPSDYGQDDIKGLCVRRFKNDVKDQVQGSFQEREISIEKVDATNREEEAFDVFAELKLEMDMNKHRIGGQLFKTSLEKSMFSSPSACIKSIEERLKKLRKRYKSEDIKDIEQLEMLRDKLQAITPKDFSRYQTLLQLIHSKEYGWNGKVSNDRIVIFTERIETMRYLVEHLREDLKLNKDAVQELYGGMKDSEQQKIVEDFGRESSNIRILVASDVASEGINLHYLSHRLIHFDIPWSLMVFQQRNGRIDRYGQNEKPDIRYFLINSKNEKIKGDLRIIRILLEKEEQAYKNIGDPTVLFGKFDVQEEELVTAEAIENEIGPEAFNRQIETTQEEFDPLELLMKGASDDNKHVEKKFDATLYSDLDYLNASFDYFTQSEEYRINDLKTVEGVELKVTQDLSRRLQALMPEEALPEKGNIRLSPNKEFCMEEMTRSLQNQMSENAWPQTQYLWELHPIFQWINDKSGLLFERNEAPMIGIKDLLATNEYIYIISGTIPNRKSTPVVDEWFGLQFNNGEFTQSLNMEEVKRKTRITGKNNLPNHNNITQVQKNKAEALLPKAVAKAKEELNNHYHRYKNEIDPLITVELDKLAELEEKHKSYQLSFVDNERKKSEKERMVEETFNEFEEWVTDTLEIEDNPYLRIIAVITGVE
ncbi:DEAD/DEAH box helicase [Isachenkonia alkalipeptolytica]|uniref:DEAD/DEAH box helicase n=1 Tax=Isachenkonia alkalipeptolytica TaxID=2565777 RepID=A0AA43XLJ9_9CLOT|nr:DEAD/DEAH box helicase [Isachenkonia alkalipeptolytica]NBG88130.1 DEAD/DEAH box helicase [Isachenkonia alkalipeptolytica]